MALEVLQSQSAVADHWPERVPSAVDATVYTSAGVLLATPEVTIDTTNVAVTGFTAPNLVAVADRSAFVDGERYILRRSKLLQSTVRVEAGGGLVGAGNLTLTSAPHFAPAAGDALRGSHLACTIPSTATAHRGTHFRVEWAGTDIDGQSFMVPTLFHVVRTIFTEPVTTAAVVDYLGTFAASKLKALQQTPQRIVDLATAANRRVRALIRATKRFPHLMGDPEAFVPAGMVALRYELLSLTGIANDNQAGTSETREDIRKELDEAVSLAIQSMEWYDADDSATVDKAKEVGPFQLKWVR